MRTIPFEENSRSLQETWTNGQGGSRTSVLIGRISLPELLEARKALEVSLAALAADKRTEDDLAAMEEALQSMEQSIGNGAKGEEADAAFHLALAGAGHNAMLTDLLQTVLDRIELVTDHTRATNIFSDPAVSVQLLREHRAICRAIRMRDASGAQEKMKLHLFHVERLIVRFARQ